MNNGKALLDYLEESLGLINTDRWSTPYKDSILTKLDQHLSELIDSGQESLDKRWQDGYDEGYYDSEHDNAEEV